MRENKVSYIDKLFEEVLTLSKEDLEDLNKGKSLDIALPKDAQELEDPDIKFRIQDEVDALEPKLGRTKVEEYKIRQILLAAARSNKDSERKRKAEAILQKVYHCRLVSAEEYLAGKKLGG